MRIFDFDPTEYRDQFAERGWVHVRGGISPEFYASLRRFAEESFGEHRVKGAAIGGKKDQALYEFPEDVDFPNEVFDIVATVGGLNRGTMTLSERHLKAYDADAPPEPAPHKDRYASQMSVGLSIETPEGSHLVLYPENHTDVNPLNVSAAYLESLPLHEQPEVALRDAREVVIRDQPGDVMMFRGSAIWHMRRHAASAINLYLKLNDFNCDPLGEDPTTPQRRRQTLQALSRDEGDFDRFIPTLSRRLDWVSRQYTRDWQEVVQAKVWEKPVTTLSTLELEVLKLADGRRSVGEVTRQLEPKEGDGGSLHMDVAGLAQREVLDLLR